MTILNQYPHNQIYHTDEERNAALDDAYDAEIAVSIIKTRHSRGLTQQDFAEILGVSQAYISQLESASVLPSHKKLKFIAKKLRARLIAPRVELATSENKNLLQFIIQESKPMSGTWTNKDFGFVPNNEYRNNTQYACHASN